MTNVTLLAGVIPVVRSGMAAVSYHFLPIIKVLDSNFGGTYRIAGTVTELALPTDIPKARRVRLYRKRDGLLVRETWSDPTTGAYAFDYLALDTYFVIAFDHTGIYNLVGKDSITSVAV